MEYLAETQLLTFTVTKTHFLLPHYSLSFTTFLGFQGIPSKYAEFRASPQLHNVDNQNTEELKCYS